MQDIKGKLAEILQELELREKNCKEEIKRSPEGRIYKGKIGGKDYYFHALPSEDGGFAKPKRTVIQQDGNLAKALAHKKFLEEIQKHLQTDIGLIRSILVRMDDWDAERIIRELPRAYKGLPESHFFHGASDINRSMQGRETQAGGWHRIDSGILVPERLVRAARQGTLSKEQKEEIREIQQEWASQEYETNTKNLDQKNKMTSRGLMTRSFSEVSIIERFYYWDVPFRYDQVIRIGNKKVSPDFSFLSITRGVIWWEHCGMTHKESYVEYHRYKRKLYESAGIVPWENYIETYNEEDGFLDIRMIDDIIKNTLLRWLHLN